MESCKFSSKKPETRQITNRAKNQKQILRTHSLRSSRHLGKNRFFLSFRPLRHPNPLYLYPSPPSRRQNLASSKYHLRRPHPDLLHVYNRHLVRLKLRYSFQPCSLDCHYLSVCIRIILLSYLGHSRQNLRLRDPTRSHTLGSISSSPRPWILH